MISDKKINEAKFALLKSELEVNKAFSALEEVVRRDQDNDEVLEARHKVTSACEANFKARQYGIKLGSDGKV